MLCAVGHQFDAKCECEQSSNNAKRSEPTALAANDNGKRPTMRASAATDDARTSRLTMRALHPLALDSNSVLEHSTRKREAFSKPSTPGSNVMPGPEANGELTFEF